MPPLRAPSLTPAVYALLAGTALVAAPGAASAAVVGFTVTDGTNCSSGACGPGPFGSFIIQDESPTSLLLTLTLASGYNFAQTKAGNALDWFAPTFSTTGTVGQRVTYGSSSYTIAAVGTVSIVNPTPSNYFTYTTSAGAKYGAMSAGVDLTAAGGQGGNVGNYAGPLVLRFTATSGLITPDIFIANSNGFVFSADVACQAALGCTGTNGSTGVAGSLYSSKTVVPEPDSIALFGAGLAALGAAAALRRRDGSLLSAG